MPDSKQYNGNPHEEWLLTSEEWVDARMEQWLGLLRDSVYGEFVNLSVEWSPSQSHFNLLEHTDLVYQPIQINDSWGKAWDYAWFRFVGQVPEAWGDCEVVARIDLGGEAGVIGADGEFCQRLTHGSVFDHWCHVDEVPLSVDAGGAVELLVQAWASNLDGINRPVDPDTRRPDFKGKHAGQLRRAEIAVLRPEVRMLLFDVEVLLGIARSSPANSVRRKRCYRALREANIAYRDTPSGAPAAREILARELQKKASASSLVTVATGHAHIDTAWMWRLQDSVGKCGRTFSHQLAYMDQYPDYVFGASSAIHYAWVKEHYPKLFERIKARVAEGRWEIQGAMWVEPDTNCPNGESLIRQFLYGSRFVQAEFDRHCSIAWLPDVFGLTGSLPQICAESGVKYLLTKKPNWGRDNAFKKTAFRWAGNDGSEILVHLLPQVRDYNGRLHSDDLARAVEGFVESDRLDTFLYTFGVGDGGGGPSEPMLERAERMRDVEGLPQVKLGTAEEVFEQIEANKNSLDTHSGEIYVEGHRGTYTTQGLLKRANRRLEVLLKQSEQICASLQVEDYPHLELEKAWRMLLTNQFHDILPGSGIREVIEDALSDYDSVEAICHEVITRAAKALPAAPGQLGFYNGLAQTWTGVVSSQMAFEGVSAQIEPDGCIVNSLKIDAQTGVNFASGVHGAETFALQVPVLENEHLRCEFNADGQVMRLLDKRSGRESISPVGMGNLLTLYVDRPVDWDAWDVDAFYREESLGTAQADGAWLGWTGPVRSVIEFKLKIGDSSIIQRCILEEDGQRIDFETKVDWAERHRMLRVGFDSGLRNPLLRCSVQHGFVDRPVHWNNSQEAARFEVPCQRWAALLNGDAGLAVLNNGKHGVRGEGSLIELALLRSSTFPDYYGDAGLHEFTYSLMPFSGAFDNARVGVLADQLNEPPLRFEDRSLEALKASIRVESENLSLECLKRSESGEAIVLRVANHTDRQQSFDLESAEEWSFADCLERERESVAGNQVILEPFRFVTLIKRS